jgi:hypothetical protein
MRSSYFYRRRLPHYREQNVIYFVTWRLVDGEELSAPERDLIAAELRHSTTNATSFMDTWL